MVHFYMLDDIPVTQKQWQKIEGNSKSLYTLYNPLYNWLYCVDIRTDGCTTGWMKCFE